MMWWWCLVALASEQPVVELEWSRGEPVQLMAQLPGLDADARVRWVRALGRLRDPATGDDLLGFRDDPEAAVRRQAATALGWVPDTAPQIRTWLAELRPVAGALEAPEAETQVRARLVRSLGHQGTARDLDTLRRALAEPWPVGEAAALALGRLAIRDMPGVREAVPDLVQRLGAPDARVAQAAAFALGRIGLEGAAPPLVDATIAAVLRGATPEARAWALRAVWPALDADQRLDVFTAAATSTSRLVKVAAFDRVSEGDIDGVLLAAWLNDPDPWVVAAAVRALGRVGSDDPQLQALADAIDADPWLAGEAVAALGRGDPAAAADAELPLPVRVAHVYGLDDVPALLALLDDEAAALRSAAAVRLLELEPEDGSALAALHGAEAPLLRELAVELRAAGPAPAADLMAWQRDEGDADVLSAIAEALVAAVEADRRALTRVDVSPLVERLAALPLPRPRAAAAALADAAGQSAPSRVALTPLVAPDADEAPSWPDLEATSRIRGARVHTGHGTVTLQLDPETAPLAVHAFSTLAEAGFYDGLVFHRVVPGFVVQGGDPRGDGFGGPGWSLPDEVSALPFDEGALGMARGGPDTGGSQWFVTTSDQPHLVGAYTRFGEVVGGLHIVRRLPRGAVIESIEIERVE